MNPLRILLVTPRFLPSIGGVQNHVYQVGRRFARQGMDVTVLTTDPGGQLAAEEMIEAMTVRRVRAWPARRDFFFAPAVFSSVRQGLWDIVHIQSYHTLVAPLAMLAARRTHLPYVVTFHGGGHSSRLRNRLRRVQRLLLRPLLVQADRLVATARFEISFFGQQLGLAAERFAFIPNGGDLMERPAGAPAAADPNLLISIGRLERYKGHHRVIAALPKILPQRPQTRLWVMGAGPYEKDLWKLARRLRVDDHVEIRAVQVAHPHVIASELSRAAVVLLMSEYETHPMAVLEALAVGRPVLVADTSGLHELAEQGLVRAVPLQSTPLELADAILEQLYRPHLPPPLVLPTWDECAEKLLALYGEVLRRRICAS